MALRIKSHWHDEDSDRSMTEIGGAIAFNVWRLAVDKAMTLNSEHFIYHSDEQRLSVIAEYLIFLIQITDRLTHKMLEAEQRQELITALVLKVSEHLQDNSQDMCGAGDYQTPFIALFNQRGAEYAEFKLTADGPSYPFLRHLGFCIQEVMGLDENNRWVIDQVMDVDAGQLYKQIRSIIYNLFD